MEKRVTKKTSVTDMTEGPILTRIIFFSLPLMLGNIFQMLYNTVDVIVVGNFVSKEALAAVGSTTVIINMLVFFFNGFSIGAGVLIGHYFGAKNREQLHISIETTMAATFLLSLFLTAVGVLGTDPMLAFMATPADVFADAHEYLTIYFAGISGLLVYNMGSGILRAVGDTKRPLLFLALTSLLNILLDLLFVILFRLGIAGVGYATILAQFISAVLTLRLLTHTGEVYRMSWSDLKIDPAALKQIFAVGLPAGIQQVITAFSNVFVQSYVNFFGSSCMAGWSCYNKLDQFIMLPIQSTSMAATTFVAQNMGAGREKRALKGTKITLWLAVGVTFSLALILFIFARSATALFTQEPSVIEYGVLFLRANVFFMCFNCVNHTLAGALRGKGDARGPMLIMLLCFVLFRQLYLFTVTRFVANTPLLVGLGYPVGWFSCCVLELIYAGLRWRTGKGNTD